MIKVVSFKICPFVQRVTAALEARNVDYDIEYIDPDNQPDWFTDISPNHQVPLLITDSGVVLFESDAIAEYIDEKFGPLQKHMTPEDRAIERAWVYQATKHYLVQCGAMTSENEETLSLRSDNLREAFSRINTMISNAPFYAGDNIGNVDVAWLPLLHRAHIIEERTGYDFLKSFPKLKEWQANLMKSGLAEKSVPTDFIDVFSAFYLSDDTYLGRGEDCITDSSISSGRSQCG